MENYQKIYAEISSTLANPFVMTVTNLRENFLRASQIIFQPELKTTVVKWNDGTTTVVKCSEGEEFVKETGFAMALVKKMFPNRSEFLRMIEKAYTQPAKKKEKVFTEDINTITAEDIEKAIRKIKSL